ncbi:MAG TPA: toxin-activating lysine-acyltransferase [Duganella sp.]|nr:toxin-activating lysine-acyltransferase [Duganella sp.]
MHSTAAIGGQFKPNSSIARQSQDLGLVCQFAARVSGHAPKPLGEMLSLLLNTHRLGQLKVYLNGYEECVGYVAWAFLTPDVEEEFISGNPRALQEWEFNDGLSPWILDMGVKHGSLSYILEDLRDEVFRDYEQLTYFRIKDGHMVCKRVSRLDHNSFMRAGRKGELA